MAKHIVEVVEAFEVRTQLGALVTTDVRTGAQTVIAPAKEHVSTYNAGEQTTFNTKPDALKFCKHHGDKVRYVGPKAK